MKRILFSVLVLIVCLSGLELIARCFSFPTLDSPSVGMQLQAHPTRIWSMRPGSQEQFGAMVTVDELGMRQTKTTPNSKKWLILGDSSFFGHGLDDNETLHHHLEETLRTDKSNIDVLCGATPGYSTLQSLDFMNEIGWDLQPSVLVIGNLWSDNNFDHFQDAEWISELHKPQHRLLRMMGQSHLFIQLTRLLRPDLLNSSVNEASPHAKISWVRDPYSSGRRRVPLEIYINTLSTIILEARDRNIAVLLIQPANKYRMDIATVEYTWDPYFKTQRAIATHFDIPILDVATTLRAFGLNKSQSFLDDMHPTGEANFWIAQHIADIWKRRQENGDAWIPNQDEAPTISLKDKWSTMSESLSKPNRDTLP